MIKTDCSECGGQIEENRIGKQRYCLVCHAAYMRKNRRRHSELTPEARARASCRSYANVYLRRGKLTRGTCECGSTNVEMHHNNYSKPLEITWICRRCHLEHHEKERTNKGASPALAAVR